MKVYGPYRMRDGRQKVVIHEDDGKRTTMSYPKYLAQQYLGRKLNEDETIDHIDNDFYNDKMSNYRIVNRKDHTKLDTRRIVPKITNCLYCDREFELTRNHYRNAKIGKAGPFCCGRCSSKYAILLQKDPTRKKENRCPPIEYYKLKHETKEVIDQHIEGKPVRIVLKKKRYVEEPG